MFRSYRTLAAAVLVVVLLLAAFAPRAIRVAWSKHEARAALEELRHSADARSAFPHLEHPEPELDEEYFDLTPLASEVAERRLVPLGELAVPALLDLYQKGAEEDVRYAVVLGLQYVRSPKSVDALLEIAGEDESSTVRSHAITALGEQGDRRALPGLLALSKKWHPQLSGQCYTAMEAITGWEAPLPGQGEGAWVAEPPVVLPDGDVADNPRVWVPKRDPRPGYVVWQERLIKLGFLTREEAPFPDPNNGG